MTRTVDLAKMREVELLAPARNIEIAREAIVHGADAVYIGAESFGARSAATNSVDEIARLCDFAHTFLARVYVTVNTIIYDDELRKVESMIRGLYRAGVDAIIVQDMGILRLDIPPIALHASTQCDIRTPARARFLEEVGFSQLVLPRELSLEEIASMREAVNIPLESFVHGALCVSYSGDCHAGALLKGRSANRGECPQICRLPFDLYDGAGQCISRNRHLLSLRDMNRSANIEEMLTAGVSSFKIEGRLKDVTYVKNICAYYRRKLDEVIARHPDLYRRSSVGRTSVSFNPAPEKSFNRGFTSYFLTGNKEKIASIHTPKSRGERVGTVRKTERGTIVADLDTKLVNGDGLGFFDNDMNFVGFRLNRIDGNRLFPASRIAAPAGAVLYRNSDKAHDDLLAKESANRLIDIDMTLSTVSGRLVLELSDERGNRCTVTGENVANEAAKTPQEDQRRNTLSKLGGTSYRMRNYNDLTGNVFIPAKELAGLRRKGIELLEANNRIRYRRELRRPEMIAAKFPEGERITYHENVANRLAIKFYRDHGVTEIEPAAELHAPKNERVVMTTRYCLRRELGACLREGGNSKLKGDLYLVSGKIRLRLDFDCHRCGMKVVAMT